MTRATSSRTVRMARSATGLFLYMVAVRYVPSAILLANKSASPAERFTSEVLLSASTFAIALVWNSGPSESV